MKEDIDENQLIPPFRTANRSSSNEEARKVAWPAILVILVVTAFTLGYISNYHINPPQKTVTTTIFDHNDFSYLKCSSAVPAGTERRKIIDKVFAGVSPWANFPPPHLAPHLRRDWEVAWGSHNPVFEHLITKVMPKTIIEVGTFLGASATHMAALTRKLGLGTQIICIDDFRGWPLFADDGHGPAIKMLNGDSILLQQYMLNVALANATESIIFLPFSATSALDALCAWGIYGDLVEIDAAHDFHSAWDDINNGYKVLRPGGVLFGHDIAVDGVNRAVNIFAKLHELRVRVHGEHWILF